MPGQLSGDTRCSCLGDVYLVASVMVERGSDVETVDAVGGPGVSLLGGSKQTIFIPGGANGVLEKENGPRRACHADTWGENGDPRSRLSVNSACSTSLSNIYSGKFGSTVQRADVKWFLKVLMALSALLARWLPGGTGWIVMRGMCSRQYCFRRSDVLLSMRS